MSIRLSLALTTALTAPLVAIQPAPKPKPAAPAPAAKPAAPAAGPVVTLETVKGTIVFETFPADAPKSVEHIVALVKRRFYDGQSIHRVVAGQLVQFGDPQTRNMQLKEWWGRGPGSGSGNPIGVAEISKKRTHRRGTVSLANPGHAAAADSQLFIAMRPSPAWDGKYTIVGQVTSGVELVPKLAVGDRIKRVTVSGMP
jgi:cyclophilin family peptidyl-prolyl cis-trans isomerase